MADVRRLTPRLGELSLSNWKRGSMAGANVWPNLDEVARRGHDLYVRAFETNDVVRAAITLARAAICGAGYEIRPGDGTSRQSVESAEQCAADLAGLAFSFD